VEGLFLNIDLRNVTSGFGGLYKNVSFKDFFGFYMILLRRSCDTCLVDVAVYSVYVTIDCLVSTSSFFSSVMLAIFLIMLGFFFLMTIFFFFLFLVG